MEFDVDSVDRGGLVTLLDQVGGRDQCECTAAWDILAVTSIDLAAFAGRQHRAELIQGTPEHGIAGYNVVGHRILHEMIGGEDSHVSGADLLLAHHALDAAEMVG